jgi:hypothetical protein
MERFHAQHLERETGSVERRIGEPLDVLRQQSDAASKLDLRQTAIEKGQTRIQDAEKFARRSTQEIEKDNQTCVNKYEERYRHELWFKRNDTECNIDIDTYVKGPDVASSCYTNSLYFQEDARGGYDHIFYGDENFKRRLPNWPPHYKWADDDIKYEQTKSLPHAHILFNQIRAANEYLAQQSESGGWPTKFDLSIYRGEHIVNLSDRKIFDTLLPEETGEVLFSKGTDEYKAIAGCDTGKAKWMLAAQLGKEISNVRLIKKKKMNNKGKLEIRCYTEYYFEVATQEPIWNGARPFTTVGERAG